MGSVAEYWLLKTFAPRINISSPKLVQEFEYYSIGSFKIGYKEYIVNIIPKVEWDWWALLWSEHHLFSDYIGELECLVYWLNSMNESDQQIQLELIAEKLGLRSSSIAHNV